MARPTELGRFDSLIRRLLSVKGSALDTVLGDVFPTLNVLDAAPELLLLRDERRWNFGAVFAASIGNFDQLTLTNPVGSGVLLVVDDLIIAGSGTDFQSGEDATLGGAFASVAPLDLRARGRRSVIQVAVNQTAASRIVAGTGTGRFTSGVQYRLGVVVPPGRAWVVESTTNNQAATLTVYARERPATSEELTAA